MKNYVDQEVCYPSTPKAEVDENLRNLHNSPPQMKAEIQYRNRFICLTVIKIKGRLFKRSLRTRFKKPSDLQISSLVG